MGHHLFTKAILTTKCGLQDLWRGEKDAKAFFYTAPQKVKKQELVERLYPSWQAFHTILVPCYMNSTTVDLMAQSLRHLLENIFRLHFPDIKTNQHVYYKTGSGTELC